MDDTQKEMSSAPTKTASEQEHYDNVVIDDIEGGVCKLPSRSDQKQNVVLRLEVVSSRDLKAIVAGLWAALLAGIILLVICAVYMQDAERSFLQHTMPLLNTVIGSVVLALVLVALAYTIQATLRASRNKATWYAASLHTHTPCRAYVLPTMPGPGHAPALPSWLVPNCAYVSLLPLPYLLPMRGHWPTHVQQHTHCCCG